MLIIFLHAYTDLVLKLLSSAGNESDDTSKETLEQIEAQIPLVKEIASGFKKTGVAAE